MAFLADSEIKKLQESHKDLVTPFCPSHLDLGAYELSIGNEVFITTYGEQKKIVLDKDKEQFHIEPGQFALLITSETVKIPANILAFISFKAKIKFKGLINVSGFHVDPTFEGKLKFSVYNAGGKTITLERGQRIFMIWFSEIIGKNDKIYNKDNFKSYITSGDVEQMLGQVTSPSALLKKIEKLEDTLNLIKTIVVGLVIAFMVSIFKDSISGIFTKNVPSENSRNLNEKNVSFPIKDTSNVSNNTDTDSIYQHQKPSK